MAAKLVTAVLSVATASTLYRLPPQALLLPSLAQCEKAFQALIDSSALAAWVTDANGRLLYVNHVYERLFKIPAGFVAGVSEVIHPPAMTQQYRQNIRQVVETQQVVEAVERGVAPDGAINEFLVFKFPLLNALGQCLVGGVVANISERRQEKALAHRLREAERIAGLGNWDYDLSTQVITWSEALFRLLGLPTAATAPSYSEHLLFCTPESRLSLDQAVQSAVTTGQPYALELQVTCADGSLLWLLVRGEAVRDPTGTITKLVGTALDLTDRKQLEAELQALGQLKDDFLSAVSHELRSPLASIKLSTYMLELHLRHCQPPLSSVFGDELAAKVSRYLLVLQTECERELSLVNELLELQRLEPGLFQPEWMPLQLLGWLPDLVGVFEARMSDRQQTLHLQVPAAQAVLLSDALLLASVLRELLTNACKYTPTGGRITVQARYNDTTLRLSVSNTGTVIPPEELPRLFEKFYRSPSADHWRQDGTGLGLALAARQAETLGGKLQVTSDPDQTVFWLELPLVPCLAFS